MCDQQSLRSACPPMQSDQCLCLSLEYSMIVTAWTPCGVSKLKRRLQRLVQVYTCQNVIFLEISCRGSFQLKCGEVSFDWKSIEWTAKAQGTLFMLVWPFAYLMASSRQNLSSGVLSKRDSNQSPQLEFQNLACSNFRDDTFQRPWSVCVDAQAGLHLFCSQTP